MVLLMYGLILGGTYAVLAAGFALVFSVGRIMNLAHTAFYMIAAYVIFVFSNVMGLPAWIAAITAIVVITLVAIILHILAIDRIKHYHLPVMMVTLAAGMLIQEFLSTIFGGTFHSIDPFIRGSVGILGVMILYQHILVVAASLVVLLCLWVILQKTRLGIAILAVSQDPEIANAMGIDVNRVVMIVMGLSAALAGFAGSLVAPTLVVSPSMWTPPLIMILAAVVLGGLGSIKGSIIGAFILGFTEAAVVILVPMGSFLRQAVALAIMVLVLMVRREGLFGVVFEEERI